MVDDSAGGGVDLDGGTAVRVEALVEFSHGTELLRRPVGFGFLLCWIRPLYFLQL